MREILFKVRNDITITGKSQTKKNFFFTYKG